MSSTDLDKQLNRTLTDLLLQSCPNGLYDSTLCGSCANNLKVTGQALTKLIEDRERKAKVDLLNDILKDELRLWKPLTTDKGMTALTRMRRELSKEEQ